MWGTFIAAGTVVLIGWLIKDKLFRTKRKVFVSYYYKDDKRYKNLLKAWAAHNDFEFYMEDNSTDISIKSNDAGSIRRVVSRRINEADYFICLIGKNTHRREWVSWEIRKAVELGKKIIAVKERKNHKSPKEIKGVGAKWAMSFNYAAIKTALDEA